MFFAEAGEGQTDGPETLEELIQGFEEDEPSGAGEDEWLRGFEEDVPVVDDEESEPDAFLDGFEDAPGDVIEESAGPDAPEAWEVDGELALTAIGNVSSDARSPWHGLSMLRVELELTLKYKLSADWRMQASVRGFYDSIYELRGRDKYTDDVLDVYENELEEKDTFVEGRLTRGLDIKIGRQIVVWGPLDNLRVVDTLNPLDLRVPGLTDIEDLRMPVTMLKLDYYLGDWNLSAMSIPEARFDETPVFGSDFYPGDSPAPPMDEPDDGFDSAQWAASLTGVFSGWDLGFYGANIFCDRAYLRSVGSGASARLVGKRTRVRMAGASTAIAAGDWLFKGETAYLDGLKFTNSPDEEYSRVDVGLGVEFSGFDETTISMEALNRHIFDYEDELKQSPDETRENTFQWSFRFSRDFRNDTLTLTLMAAALGIAAEDGAYQRLEAEYDITDAVSVRGGAIFYQSGDIGLFREAGGNDRLFLVLMHWF